MKLSVISPTLNEAENIPRLVRELDVALSGVDYEILIVDDDSPDLTWSVAEEIASTNPRVRILRRTHNPGLGLTVMDGFSAATGDVIACIDADLQHDPSILIKMLEEFDKGADVVIGSRHVAGGSTGEWDRLRRLQSWFATRTAQFLLGIRLKDPMSGYFLVSRRDFEGVKEDLNGNGFKILLEILANLRDAHVMEVPYTFRSRTLGESKLSNKVIFQYFQQIWRLCSSSRHLPIRFLKSAESASVDVLLNLGAMALLLSLTNLHNWEASALACVGMFGMNYVLHRAVAFAGDVPRPSWKGTGFLSFLSVSFAGLAVTAASYGELCRMLVHGSIPHMGDPVPIFYTRMSCQTIAVLFGMGFTYAVHRMFGWPDPARLGLGTPAKAPIFR
ncbi:MAG: glycosyltransferase family 2 protein [Bryobacteraceae bacterium]